MRIRDRQCATCIYRPMRPPADRGRTMEMNPDTERRAGTRGRTDDGDAKMTCTDPNPNDRIIAHVENDEYEIRRIDDCGKLLRCHSRQTQFQRCEENRPPKRVSPWAGAVSQGRRKPGVLRTMSNDWATVKDALIRCGARRPDSTVRGFDHEQTGTDRRAQPGTVRRGPGTDRCGKPVQPFTDVH